MADLSSLFAAQARKPTMAELLMKQAIDTSPTPSAGAALARALQGGLAGYFDKQDQDQAGSEFDTMTGLKAGAPAQPSFGQRIGSFLMGGGDTQPKPSPPDVAPASGPRVYDANELSPIDAQVASPQQRMAAYGPTIDAAAKQYNLDPQMLGRQLTQESKLNPMAVSPKGAAGIGQLMPGTAKDLGVTDVNDPQQSINGSAAYMRQNLDRFGGNQNAALAAYNWGPENAQRWQAQGGDPSKLPAETQGYIRNITGGNQTADNAALPPNSAPAQGTLPGQQPQGPMQRQAPQIPPDILSRARTMYMQGDPQSKAAAMAILQPYMAPKDQTRPITTPDERAKAGIPATDQRPYQMDTATGKVSSIDNSPTINMQANTTGETEYSKGKAQDALGLERSADKTMMERQKLEVFKSLVSDFKTGKLAPAQSTMGAWGDAIGISPETMSKLGIPPNAARQRSAYRVDVE
jgi:hypothetical protein